MDVEELRAQQRVADQLIKLVGEPPLVTKLIQQGEPDEAVLVLRQLVAERHIQLPAHLAA